MSEHLTLSDGDYRKLEMIYNDYELLGGIDIRFSRGDLVVDHSARISKDATKPGPGVKLQGLRNSEVIQAVSSTTKTKPQLPEE